MRVNKLTSEKWDTCHGKSRVAIEIRLSHGAVEASIERLGHRRVGLARKAFIMVSVGTQDRIALITHAWRIGRGPRCLALCPFPHHCKCCSSLKRTQCYGRLVLSPRELWKGASAEPGPARLQDLYASCRIWIFDEVFCIREYTYVTSLQSFY